MDVHADLSTLVAEFDESSPCTDSLYATLAPVYEFMFASNSNSNQHFSDQLHMLREATSNTGRSVLEVGCGTGRLLPKLTHEYETIVGVDIHEKMVSLARQRAPSVTILQADMRNVTLDQSFDAVVLFEFVASLIEDEIDVHNLFNNCYEHLNPDGRLLCEVVDEPEVVVPVSPQVFEDSRFRIERTVTEEDWLTSDVFIMKFSYCIYEKRTSQKVRAFEETPIRLFTASQLRTLLTETGLVDVCITDDGDGITGRARRFGEDASTTLPRC